MSDRVLSETHTITPLRAVLTRGVRCATDSLAHHDTMDAFHVVRVRTQILPEVQQDTFGPPRPKG